MRIGNTIPFSQTDWKKIQRDDEKNSRKFSILSNLKQSTAGGSEASDKIRSQAMSIEKAMGGLQDTISLNSVADTALASQNESLQRMRELAVGASNSPLSSEERNAMQTEFDALSEQIDKTAENATFNDKKVISGMTSQNLGLKGLMLGDASSLSTIDSAIQKISDSRASFGASTSSAEKEIQKLSSEFENLNASLSRIEDVDVAKELSTLLTLQLAHKFSMWGQAHSRLNMSNVSSLLGEADNAQ